MPLVAIAHPAVDIDLRYATADNLTGHVLYDRAAALLHAEAFAALARAADLAAAQGLRLRVLDAFRPARAQWQLWQRCPDPNFVADPRIGSMHTRGIAVDLTLAAPDGTALDMGTAFDEMTERSAHGCIDLPAAAQRHRVLLLGLMTLAGFVHHPHEWWHYNLPDWQRYPLLGEADEARVHVAP